MSPGAEPIRIIRGPGGEVEAEGRFDSLAADILRHAGFLFEPALRGHWIRLPFDMGRDWENQHATWTAEMLTAARYRVHLALDLRPGAPESSRPLTPAMTAQAPPGRRPRR
ncbi:hypothetical protein [Streptomyces sp. NPDC050388]|uniref:hypothetical protein n=1 Tax=Streptomyces sp. NPDC050388 TaxID=3155781 RepID=UPI0034243443